MCVRLDRRAVYLGTPSASQRCPAHAVGRRRAILLDPGLEARPAQASARASSAPGGAATPATAAIASGPFTGLGFDACSAPSSRTMSAWSSSPYQAIGVYIGGANRACSQPNLTTSWVGAQVAAGWRLIPTYVGLQAPTSSCGSCAKLSSNKATGQGTAQAEDAVEDAQSVGIGPGNPIYFDMEAYTRTSSASRATLTFLSAWTAQLHALGYASGVYSSSASGIADIAGEVGTGYLLPDDLWMANWNGREDTLDPYVPSTSWNKHQRIHQFRGGHNETYGGATIDIDSDYVEGATVGAAASPPPAPAAAHRLAGEAGCGDGAGQGSLRVGRRRNLPRADRPSLPRQGRGPRTPRRQGREDQGHPRRRRPPHLQPRRRPHPYLPGQLSTPAAARCCTKRERSRPSCWWRSPAPAPSARSNSSARGNRLAQARGG